MKYTAGFTLIELVMVMIIIGVVSAGLVTLLSNTSKAMSVNETLQQATQYAQECAERAVAKRQEVGFNSFPSNFSCGNPTGFTRSVVVGNVYTGTGACPSGINCRNVTITVTSSANSALNSPITIMLADY